MRSGIAQRAAGLASACLAGATFVASAYAQSWLMPRLCIVSFAAAWLAARPRGVAWRTHLFAAAASCAPAAGLAAALTSPAAADLSAGFSLSAFAFGLLALTAAALENLQRRRRRRYLTTDGA